jgi:hypothetical protein
MRVPNTKNSGSPRSRLAGRSLHRKTAKLAFLARFFGNPLTRRGAPPSPKGRGHRVYQLWLRPRGRGATISAVCGRYILWTAARIEADQLEDVWRARWAGYLTVAEGRA